MVPVIEFTNQLAYFIFGRQLSSNIVLGFLLDFFLFISPSRYLAESRVCDNICKISRPIFVYCNKVVNIHVRVQPRTINDEFYNRLSSLDCVVSEVKLKLNFIGTRLRYTNAKVLLAGAMLSSYYF